MKKLDNFHTFSTPFLSIFPEFSTFFMFRIRTAVFSLPRNSHFVRIRCGRSISMEIKTEISSSDGSSTTTTMDKPIEATIRRKLEVFFSPFGLLHIDVINESHKHNVPKVCSRLRGIIIVTVITRQSFSSHPVLLTSFSCLTLFISMYWLSLMPSSPSHPVSLTSFLSYHILSYLVMIGIGITFQCVDRLGCL